jgi:membrane fusion protein, multidrug efflux system
MARGLLLLQLMAAVRPQPADRATDGSALPSPPPRPSRRWYLVGAIVLVLVLAVGGGAYWWHVRGVVSTDDAFIEAHVIQIGPKIGGQVIEVKVTDNQRVREGDVLVRIDPRDYSAAAEQARAQVRASEVEARRTKTDAQRVTALFERGLVARQDLDHAVAAEHTAAANLEAARQRLNESSLQLSYTTLTAPEAGRVTRKAVEEGMFVQPGQLLMAVVTDELWVVANFKETQLKKMRVGQKAVIQVDAYPKRDLHGHVESIAAATGARFALLPPDNATGNFTKVVQRVPVKIVFDEPPDPERRLRAGMSVNAIVDVREDAPQNPPPAR